MHPSWTPDSWESMRIRLSQLSQHELAFIAECSGLELNDYTYTQHDLLIRAIAEGEIEKVEHAYQQVIDARM